MDKIEDTARKTGKGVGEMKRLARNREDWRKWIEAVRRCKAERKEEEVLYRGPSSGTFNFAKST